jgi:hypothetical protein
MAVSDNSKQLLLIASAAIAGFAASYFGLHLLNKHKGHHHHGHGHHHEHGGGGCMGGMGHGYGHHEYDGGGGPFSHMYPHPGMFPHHHHQYGY